MYLRIFRSRFARTREAIDEDDVPICACSLVCKRFEIALKKYMLYVRLFPTSVIGKCNHFILPR